MWSTSFWCNMTLREYQAYVLIGFVTVKLRINAGSLIRTCGFNRRMYVPQFFSSSNISSARNCHFLPIDEIALGYYRRVIQRSIWESVRNISPLNCFAASLTIIDISPNPLSGRLWKQARSFQLGPQYLKTRVSTNSRDSAKRTPFKQQIAAPQATLLWPQSKSHSSSYCTHQS